jgi:hypothetical protein
MASLRDSGLITLCLCLCLCSHFLALDEQQLETQVQDELGTRPRRLRWRSDTVLNRLPFSPRVPNDDNEAYLLEHQRNEARILGGEQVRHCTVLLTSLSLCLAS